MNRRERRANGIIGAPDRYFQSADYNTRVYEALRAQAIGLALNRFKWVGLPETCDQRYLELQLLFKGCATIAHPRQSPDMWCTLQCAPNGIPNMYGNPTAWHCIGDNGTDFEADPTTGVVIYDNSLRFPPIMQIEMWVRELTDVIRTKQINRLHCKTPFIIECPQEMQQQAANIFKQISGNEPGIIVSRGFEAINLKVHQTGAVLLTEELTAEERNIWARIYAHLGIANATAKAERMVAEEVKLYHEPTEIMKMDYLACRRRAAQELNDRFGFDVRIVSNEDTYSKTYNYTRDMQQIMEDLDTVVSMQPGDEND